MTRRRIRDGFTLVEVLVAMGLFLVGITALMGLFQMGGGMENASRAHASLSPAIEPLIARIRAEAWVSDSSGTAVTLREYKGETVPGAPGYRYDLEVDPAADDPNLRRAALRFYRTSPERPVATVRFLLTRTIPLQRRLQPSS